MNPVTTLEVERGQLRISDQTAVPRRWGGVKSDDRVIALAAVTYSRGENSRPSRAKPNPRGNGTMRSGASRSPWLSRVAGSTRMLRRRRVPTW